jgi:hypothetical protein
MSTSNAPKNIIRECDLILSGELQKTPEQLQRWMVVQIKKLATQSAARHSELGQLRNKVKRSTEA